MALSPSKACSPIRFKAVRHSFLQHDSFVFADILTEQHIEAKFRQHKAMFTEDEDPQEVVYTPAVTLWAFLSQMVFQGAQRSCRAAVMRVVLALAIDGRSVSENTGAYCRARAKLSLVVLQDLTLDLADGCERALDEPWLWLGKHVFLVDGTTVSMPDTLENQAEWPQQSQQQEGLGFPIARVVAVLSLATGMLAGMSMGPYQGKETGETALFRELLDRFQPGDVIVADRFYCSYFMIALAQERGLDVVFRQHQRRPTDFRRGQRLGNGDHIVAWERPARPTWMDQETYDRMPERLEIRQTQVHVREPGFRTKEYVVATTLTDADTYWPEDIGELYYQRWLAELDIRSIKTYMELDILRSQSAEMIRKELWGGLLAYNLIRKTMLEAAATCGASPRCLSFTAAMQAINASWETLCVLHKLHGNSDAILAHIVSVLLDNLASCRVGNRPGRTEPRAVKRRPKGHLLLTKPRAEARQDRALVGGRKKHS